MEFVRRNQVSASQTLEIKKGPNRMCPTPVFGVEVLVPCVLMLIWVLWLLPNWLNCQPLGIYLIGADARGITEVL
jgi:hypothetical protein